MPKEPETGSGGTDPYSRHRAGPSVRQTGVFRRRTPKKGTPRALRIEREGSEPLNITLYPDRTYVFGRAPEASFVFASDAISRLHGQLRFREDGWHYRDLNSTNGSFLLLDEADGSSEKALPRATPGRSLLTEGDASEGGLPRRRVRQIGSQDEYVLGVGDTVLLANGRSRLEFLAEPPEGAAASSSGGVLSPASQRLERQVEVCARHRLPVFLLGPSGSGKTFLARAIHERSRMTGHFVILNCGRLPHDPAQLASELLGHVRGAFTGAVSARKGKLASANGGTLFLDEVESMPRVAQDFLLDVLEGSGSYAPYGASGEQPEPPPHFRLISASKAPLNRSGLRKDLSQRLATGDVVPLPSLTERREDIPRLIATFVERLRAEQQLDAELTEEAVRFLQAANWPGEIRELESTVRVVVNRELAGQMLDGLRPERVVVGLPAVRTYLDQRQVGFGEEEPPPISSVPTGRPRKRPADLTAEDLRRALGESGGNKARAADLLGICVNTLKARLKALG